MKEQYQIIKSRRKTVEIRVLSTLEVVVKAPVQMKNSEIERLLIQKSGWIEQKRMEMARRIEQQPVRCYQNGASFPWQGKMLPLVLQAVPVCSAVPVQVADDQILVTAPQCKPQQVKALLEQWYRLSAQQIMAERVNFYSEILGETVAMLRIKNQKRRWGSCSSKRNINLNWRLIMAPPHVLDYVVVHELCHLKHMNHSREFWNCVGQILPHYRVSKAWLREYGDQLEW